MITTQFSTAIHHRLPQVYRYEKAQYVDAFLNEGKLRLNSYKKYRKDDHDERGDELEGVSYVSALFNNARYGTTIDVSLNAYIFCTSAITSKNIAESFSTNDCYVIADVNLFAEQIARNIPGCQAVLLGFCNYCNTLDQYYPHISYTPGNEIDLKQFTSNSCRIEPYFQKSMKFFHQAEYRFVFITDRESDDFIDITSKSATQFCMRVNI